MIEPCRAAGPCSLADQGQAGLGSSAPACTSAGLGWARVQAAGSPWGYFTASQVPCPDEAFFSWQQHKSPNWTVQAHIRPLIKSLLLILGWPKQPRWITSWGAKCGKRWECVILLQWREELYPAYHTPILLLQNLQAPSNPDNMAQSSCKMLPPRGTCKIHRKAQLIKV